MISLKRNGKTGELVEATGITSQKWRIYQPYQKKDFTLSRSRYDAFKTCQRCFYLKTNRGFMEPSTPGWTLNTLTDTLLKKEFDICRSKKQSHRILINNGLDHIIPFQHEDIDKWRNSISGGLKHRFKKTNIILQGGVDDVWFNTKTEELIVADYKSQQKNEKVTQETYFNGAYKDGYKRQLDFYAYLLKSMGFKVSSDAYFYICNAKEVDEGFHGKMLFDEVLIHYQVKTDYLEEDIQEMINVMNSNAIPESHKSCENCAYARQRSGIEFAEGL